MRETEAESGRLRPLRSNSEHTKSSLKVVSKEKTKHNLEKHRQFYCPSTLSQKEPTVSLGSLVYQLTGRKRLVLPKPLPSGHVGTTPA